MPRQHAVSLIVHGLALLVSDALEALPAWTRLTSSITHVQHLEMQIMATAAEIQTKLDALGAALTDYTADVGAALQKLTDQIAAMQTTLDAALANDATDAATIADLRSQLDAMNASTTAVGMGLDALTQAVTAADAPVDRPAPPSA